MTDSNKKGIKPLLVTLVLMYFERRRKKIFEQIYVLFFFTTEKVNIYLLTKRKDLRTERP